MLPGAFLSSSKDDKVPLDGPKQLDRSELAQVRTGHLHKSELGLLHGQGIGHHPHTAGRIGSGSHHGRHKGKGGGAHALQHQGFFL